MNNSKVFFSSTIIRALKTWQQLEPGEKLGFMGDAVVLERASVDSIHGPTCFKASFLGGVTNAYFTYNEVQQLIDKLVCQLNEDYKL